jgi:ferrous-iron efflux pump FieF
MSAGLASVAVASVLVALKLWALGTTGALSVAASLADSAMDLMVSLGALAAIIYAAKPADEDHAFGHTSAEDLAALGQSVFILISAAIIAWAAAARLFSAEPVVLRSEGQGMAVMGISILLTLGLVLWQRRVAARTGSRVVRADSLHYLGDLLPNIGAIVSLWASPGFGLTQIDSVVALGAAAMLAIGAVRIGKGAFDALMDRRADPRMIARISQWRTLGPASTATTTSRPAPPAAASSSTCTSNSTAASRSTTRMPSALRSAARSSANSRRPTSSSTRTPSAWNPIPRIPRVSSARAGRSPGSSRPMSRRPGPNRAADRASPPVPPAAPAPWGAARRCARSAAQAAASRGSRPVIRRNAPARSAPAAARPPVAIARLIASPPG